MTRDGVMLEKSAKVLQRMEKVVSMENVTVLTLKWLINTINEQWCDFNEFFPGDYVRFIRHLPCTVYKLDKARVRNTEKDM